MSATTLRVGMIAALAVETVVLWRWGRAQERQHDRETAHVADRHDPDRAAGGDSPQRRVPKFRDPGDEPRPATEQVERQDADRAAAFSHWLRAQVDRSHPGTFVAANVLRYQPIPKVDVSKAVPPLAASAPSRSPLPPPERAAAVARQDALNEATELRTQIASDPSSAVRHKLEARLEELEHPPKAERPWLAAPSVKAGVSQ